MTKAQAEEMNKWWAKEQEKMGKIHRTPHNSI